MASEREVLLRIKAESSGFAKAVAEARTALSGLTDDINTSNERSAWLAQGFAALAPALVPLGAAAVPVLSGIATQATIAAGAAGVLALGFNGVGTALKALNTYQLAPTQANLDKLHLAMAKLGPDGAEFVRFLDDAKDKLAVLQSDARRGMFPGIEDGIDSLLNRLPEVQRIVSEIASGIGKLAKEAGKSLAGDDWDAFFQFLETDAKPILVDMGKTLGNFTLGLANMLAAFSPLSRQFSDGLLGWSRAFRDWSAGLSESKGFRDFVDYVQQAGPQALHFLGALSDAIIEIVKAAAPVGNLMLHVLTPLVELIAAVADTPAGQLFIFAAALTSVFGRMKALGELLGGGSIKKFFTGGYREDIGKFGSAIGKVGTSIGDLTAPLASVATSQEAFKAATIEATEAAKIEATALAELEAAQARLTQARERFAQAAGSPVLDMGPTRGVAGLSDITTAQRRYEDALREVEVAEKRAAAASHDLAAAEALTVEAADKAAAAQKELDAVTAASATRTRENAKRLGAIAGQAALLGVALSPLPEKFHLTNTAMGALIGSMEGPYGIAIGAGVGAILDIASASKSATVSVDDLTDSIDRQTGAWTESSREIVAKRLLDAGVLDDAKQLGISLDTVTDAALNQGDAYKSLLTQLEAIASAGTSVTGQGEFLTDDAKAAESLHDELLDTNGVVLQSRHDFGLLKEATGGYGKVTVQSATRLQALKQALDTSRSAAHDSAESFFDLANAYEKPTLTLDKLLDRMKAYADAANNFGTNLQKALEMGANPKALQALIDQLGPAAGLAIQQMVNKGKAGIRELNAAFGTLTSSKHNLADIEGAIGGVNTALKNLPKDVRTKILADGIPKTEADISELQRKYKLTPEQVVTLTILKDLASGKLKAVQRLLADVDGTVAHTTIITDHVNAYHGDTGSNLDTHVSVGGHGGRIAGGGTVPGPRMPYGDKMLAWLAPGEEVISNQNGEADRFRRDRALGLIPHYADGGTIPGGSGGAAIPSKYLDRPDWIQQTIHWLNTLGLSWHKITDILGDSAKLWKAEQKELKDTLKEQEKERDAIKDRIDAERELKKSIMDSIANIIQSSADLLGTVKTWVIPAVGSTDALSTTDSPATFASASAALDTQLATGEQLSQVLHKLHKKGFSDDAIQWLIQNGATLATLQDFANQSRADLAAFEAQFDANTHLQHLVGQQANGELGITADLKDLLAEYRDAKAQIRETNRHLKEIGKRLDHLDNTGPERTGTAAGKAAANAMQNNASRASRMARH